MLFIGDRRRVSAAARRALYSGSERRQVPVRACASISLEHGRPCSRLQSAQRNFILLVPGLNVVATVLEALAVTRDPQGQRLGDMLANTQVIEGLGAKELATSLQRALLGSAASDAARTKQPVEVK